MNGKERRGIIDSVAGIADFEDKKKEAMGELNLVKDRIKEAQLVMGERRAFLDELGREKETALRYLDSKKTLTNAQGHPAEEGDQSGWRRSSAESLVRRGEAPRPQSRPRMRRHRCGREGGRRGRDAGASS